MKMKFFIILTVIIAIITISIPVLAEIDDITEEAVSTTESVDSSDTGVSPSEEETETTELEISEVEKAVTDISISEDSISEEKADEEATAETQARSINSIESYYGKYANTFGQKLNSAYRNNYSDASIDMSTGTMAVNVTDLYISGKNGLDLKIDRTFNSGTSPMADPCTVSYSEKYDTKIGYSKRYYVENTNTSINVFFHNELEMLSAGDSFNGKDYTTIHESDKLHGTGSTAYYFNDLYPYNGPFTYILCDEQEAQPYYDETRIRYGTNSYVSHPQYIHIKNGWCLQFPSMGWCYREINDNYRTDYYIFQDRFNQVHSLSIDKKRIDYSPGNYVWTYHQHELQSGYSYSLAYVNKNDITIPATHPAGFQYHLTITGDNGDKYYFYTSSDDRQELVAITDRYDNIIRINFSSGNYTIIDTYGVTYTCNENGITRTHGDTTTELVKYTWEEINSNRDPRNECTIDNTSVLTITKNSGTSPTIAEDEQNKTTYYMNHAYVIGHLVNVSQWLTYTLPYKVVLPTGLEKHISYKKRMGYITINDCYVECYDVSEYYETNGENGDIKNHIKYTFDIRRNMDAQYTTKYADVEYYNGNNIEKTIRVTNDDYYGLPIEEYIIKSYSSLKKEYGYYQSRPIGRISGIVTSYPGWEITHTIGYNYTGAKPSGFTNGLYSENQTFYSGNYSLPHIFTYTKDANTTVKVENLLTEDGKSIATQNTYENDVLKSTTNYTYDTYGNVTSQSVTREGGTTATTTYTHTYSGDGNHTIVTRQENILDADDNEASDIVTSQTFDWRGNLISSTDANGNTTTTTYDLINRPLTVTHPDTSQEIYTYDIANNTSTLQVESGAKYYATFDEWGNRTKYERGSANYTARTPLEEYTYDPLGRVAEFMRFYNENDYTLSQYTYDFRNRCTSEKIYDENDTLLKTTSYTYSESLDSNNLLITNITRNVTGDNGTYASVQETYNHLDQLIQTKQVSGNTQRTYTYANDYVGNLLSVTDPKGNTTSYTYDYANRPLSETDALGNTKYYTYNTLGLVSSESDYMNNITHYTYDNAGRVLTVTSPFDETGDAFTKYYYDANGNVTRTMTKSHFADEDEETYTITDYGYDNMNRISYSAIYPTPTAPIYTNYTYSKNGMNRSIVSGNNSPSADNKSADAATTNYLYNKYGDLDTVEYEDIRYFYEHDIQGRLKYLEITDFSLSDYRYTQYTYDDFDNLTSRMSTSCYDSESDVNVSYTYNLMGQRTSMTDSTGTTNYTYSPFGELTQETKGGIIKTYTYDALSNRTGFTLTAVGAEQINSSYTYDALSRLTGYSANGYTTAYGYDANSNMTSATKVDGTVETSTYNLANMLTSTIRTDENGDSVDRYYYKYYYDGKIYSKKNFDQDLIFNRFKYDGAGRISMDFCTGDLDGYRDLYTYDTRGNIIAIEHTNNEVSPSVKTNITYTYDKTNRLLSKTDGTDTYTYSYLSTGETSSVNKNGSAIRSYGYDAAGRLASSVADGISATYTYDGDNMRQSKTIGSVTTNEIYDGANLVATITSGNVNKYLRGTRLEAYQTPDESGMYTSGISYGIIRTMPFDENGNTSELDYDLLGYTAFGKYQLNSANTNSVNPFGYNGEVTDTDTGTGLIYLRNRYYDPEIGRFLTVDPAMDGTNWYAYCNNDPVNRIDPFGLAWDGFDMFLPIYAQSQLQKLTNEYNAVGDTLNEDGGYIRDDIHKKAMEIRTQYLDLTYLKYAVNDFESLGITENNYREKLEISDPNMTYEQVRYTYAMELQNSSSTKYMLRDADGKLDDAWLNAVKRIGRNIGKTPRNNQAQNEQTKAAAKKYNLSKEGQRLLHDNVSKNGYGYQEILEEAKAIAEMGGKYVK